MKTSMRKYVALLMGVIMMFTLVAASAMAADAEPRSYTNPVFYSGKVYAYNVNTGEDRLVAHAEWSWGTASPDMMYMPYSTYVECSGGKYTGWKVVYEGNAKDCSYIRIHDGNGTTYVSGNLSLNNGFKATFYCDGYTSAESFYMDWTVGGRTIYNGEIGGFTTR